MDLQWTNAHTSAAAGVCLLWRGQLIDLQLIFQPSDPALAHDRDPRRRNHIDCQSALAPLLPRPCPSPSPNRACISSAPESRVHKQVTCRQTGFRAHDGARRKHLSTQSPTLTVSLARHADHRVQESVDKVIRRALFHHGSVDLVFKTLAVGPTSHAARTAESRLCMMTGFVGRHARVESCWPRRSNLDTVALEGPLLQADLMGLSI
ncbi:hypothetical protein QBC47DRAFT_381758 [Echria macrotheca]|uniref:Uncharacterized protein n=1 Tax=Echria macrotheca TaxID=438768 RepID=A0AAJ0BF40_9PEZI|nr:hypothetical protein QBC47DRAFT_381758 [Echria macrotheca]